MPVPKTIAQIIPLVGIGVALYSTGFCFAKPSWIENRQKEQNRKTYESYIHKQAGLKDPHASVSH